MSFPKSETSQNQKTILVVDDHNEIRFLVRSALLKALPGISIKEATSGMTAAVELARSDIALVVSDVQMHGGDSLWLHYFIKEFHSKISMVFFTASPKLIEALADEPKRMIVSKDDLGSLVQSVSSAVNSYQRSGN